MEYLHFELFYTDPVWIISHNFFHSLVINAAMLGIGFVGVCAGSRAGTAVALAQRRDAVSQSLTFSPITVMARCFLPAQLELSFCQSHQLLGSGLLRPSIHRVRISAGRCDTRLLFLALVDPSTYARFRRNIMSPGPSSPQVIILASASLPRLARKHCWQRSRASPSGARPPMSRT